MPKPYREPPSVEARQDSYAEWTCEGKPKDISSRGDVPRVKRDRFAATRRQRGQSASYGRIWVVSQDRRLSCPM